MQGRFALAKSEAIDQPRSLSDYISSFRLAIGLNQECSNQTHHCLNSENVRVHLNRIERRALNKVFYKKKEAIASRYSIR